MSVQLYQGDYDNHDCANRGFGVMGALKFTFTPNGKTSYISIRRRMNELQLL